MIEATLTFADVSIDLLSHHVTRAGRHVALSSSELRFLMRLCADAPAIVSRYDLHIDVVGRAYQTESNVLSVTVSRLREKLGEPLRNPQLVLTDTFGYRLIEPVAVQMVTRAASSSM